MDAASLFSRPGRFDCETLQNRLGAGDFWAISEPLGFAQGAGEALLIRQASLWQDGMTLYALHADGRISAAHMQSGNASPHLQLGAIIEQELAANGSPVVRLLWHVRGSANLRGIVGDPRISTTKESTRSNLVMGSIYAGFAGLCIALLVYNLALWRALGHRFQLAYCAMVASLLLYAFSSSGALAWALPGIDNNDRLRINYVMLALSAIAALEFTRTFFEARVLSPALCRLTSGVIIALAGSTLLFTALAPWRVASLEMLYALCFLALISSVVAILWNALRQRSRFLWMFLPGWLGPVAVATLRTCAGLHLIPYGFWLDDGTILSMAVEALLSSIAIAHRVRLLSQERDLALAQELSARLLADTDPLTGLLNRRAFLSRGIGQPGERQLVLVDIDYFKGINEAIGHEGGDTVLAIFARTLAAAAPAGFTVARMGGEEFALLGPSVGGCDAAHVLANLREANMPHGLRVTASIGVACGPLRNDEDWIELYRRADVALYRAKDEGRDRACVLVPLAA